MSTGEATRRTEAVRWFGRPFPLWTDVVVALAGVGICLVEGSFVARFGPTPVYLSNLGLHLVIAGATVVRRHWVVGSFVVVYGGLAALAILVATSPVGLGISPILLAAPLSLYAITRRGPTPRWGVAALLLGIVSSFWSPAAYLRDPAHPNPTLTIGMVLVHVLLLVSVHLVAADRRRTEDERVAEQRRRSAADDLAAANRARLAAGAERLRIAREVHDIVGHALSVVQVQSSTALVLGEAAQRTALEAVRDASSTALADTRSLVAMLRDDAGAGPVGDLTGLPDLVAASRAAGLDVSANLPEDLVAWQQRLAADVRLALLRGAQECLTNALRHADPPRAELCLTIDEEQAVLMASNPSRADDPDPGGYGLLGLRERVEAAGGAMSVRHDGRHRGAFVVEVSIPTRAEEQRG